MYPPTSSSPSQKSTGPPPPPQPPGLTRYGSAPSSLIATAVDAVIGAEREFGANFRSPSLLGGGHGHGHSHSHSHSHGHYFSGDSSSITSQSTCKVNSSSSSEHHNRTLHRSHGLNDIAARIGSSSSSSSSSDSPSSSLLRQRSSPAGFLNHLTATATADKSGNAKMFSFFSSLLFFLISFYFGELFYEMTIFFLPNDPTRKKTATSTWGPLAACYWHRRLF
ncbi:hypothetical protein TIFTF001_028773 [Ficus carica]|uniref:Uncharacterized protein n=1 Tax=Ficus carica TaxID=3494 RepID=A0AA88DSB7_FICCA|nr:hypothetical protein TIFTF001_028773 [Ficus carica]